jgi:hypothetical protein
MITIENKRINNVLFYALVVFGILIGLHALVIRYPVDFLLPLVKALWLVGGIFIYGFFFNFLFKEKEVECIDACAAGLVFTTLFFFLISFFKILFPFIIILYYVLPLPLLYFIIKRKKHDLQQTLHSFFQRPAKEYLIFLFPLIYASLPSSFYDTLVYHLGIPNLYLHHQGFVSTPQFLFANTSIYYEISLIPAVFAGDLVPRLFHFLVGMFFLLSLGDFAVQFFNVKKRFILLLLLVSMPVTIFLLTTVKNDLLSALFILAGIKYYLKNRIKLSALFWGFSIGVKYFNALALGIFLILVFFKEKKLKVNVRVIFIFTLIAAGTLLPLFIKNYVLIGNPFFPFFNNHFPSEYFDASRYALMKADVGTNYHSVRDLIKFPYTLSFYELGSGGIVGAQFLIFLPFLFLKKQKKYFLLVFSLLFLLMGAHFTASIRFMYAAFAILSIYTVIVYQSLDIPGIKILKYLFFLIIGLNVITSFGFHERIYRSYYLYSGKLDMEQYKAFGFPSYPAVAYVNKHAPENSNALVVGDARNYYLKRPYCVSSSIDYSILKKYLSISHTVHDFITSLKQDNINYIIYNAREFYRLQKEYYRLNKEEMIKFSNFLNHLKFKQVFKERELYVFKIS